MVPKKLKYFVSGEWSESTTRKYMPITDSNTGEVVAETPCCTAEEVKSAVADARKAFPA
jgi:malonate-semialdehyde dehydrogenase (acetylating)/methylmalonate-semialdehyde dehydrogenase